MSRSVFFVTVASIFFWSGLSAQEMPPIPDMRTCETMEQDSINKLKYPNSFFLDDFELLIQEKIQEMESRKAAGRIEEPILSIPIVFHIVHNGEAVGSGTNISNEAIQAQIEVLNEDFQRLPGTNGFNDNPVGADIQIEFCLASVDEFGQALDEPGVDRVRGSRSAWTRGQIEGELKPSTYWNPNLYYNIWSVNFDTEDALLLGYAQFPSASGLNGLPENGGLAVTDGVVLRYTVVGSETDGRTFPHMQGPYNLGRTLTHETGHWLGLRHIWGDGDCSADDFCADTPSAVAPNRGCPIGLSTCGSIDMVENYMDYTNDACMNIFTQDQKARMLAVMELSPRRGSVANGQACIVEVTEAPVANFTSDINFSLLGGTVRFSDLSSNFPNQWEWTFEGGNPGFSTSRNPIVTYNTPGLYDVSLTVTNSIGTSEELILSDYIEVSEDGLCNQLSNFGESTPSLLEVPETSGETGYIAGNNTSGTQAISEFFPNVQRYTELSSVDVFFGVAKSDDPLAAATIQIWNALGPQNAPGRLVEERKVLYREIQDDIANGNPTSITFGRRVPLFLGTPFHVVVQLPQTLGDTLAVISSQDGELTSQTGWEQDKDGVWQPYSIFWGTNIGNRIISTIGMKSSVQLESSALDVFVGNKVTLRASGASIFQWSSSDGTADGLLGPEITVRVNEETTYTVSGSGLDLCNDEASTTIYIRESPLSIKTLTDEELILYPNPASSYLNIELSLAEKGRVEVSLIDLTGKTVDKLISEKTGNTWKRQWSVQNLKKGVYVMEIRVGNYQAVRKITVK